MIKYLRKELITVQSWTDRVMDRINEEDWKRSPEGFRSNINWQIGHLSISTYFHAILCISGSDDEVKKYFNPKQYSTWYGMNSIPGESLNEKPDPLMMRENLNVIDRRCKEILSTLNETDLNQATLLKNPVADTKRDALSWAIKHRMWHNGQIAMIASALGS